jgi:putative hemolysin
MSMGFLSAPISTSLFFPPAGEDEPRKWNLDLSHGPYGLRLAQSDEERAAAYRLRFEVFNLELREGLETAYTTGQDVDEYDSICDHLIVEDRRSAEVVGTYRLQTGATAAANAGYYSEREFDFTPYRHLSDPMIELGRACIAREHRSSELLFLLWRGIVQYAKHYRARYLIGCSSLTSQDPVRGTAVYSALEQFIVEPVLRTVPRPAFSMSLVQDTDTKTKVPKLLRTYLAVGAKICGPPAIDCEFKTIDFLTLMDLADLSPRLHSRFLRP